MAGRLRASGNADFKKAADMLMKVEDVILRGMNKKMKFDIFLSHVQKDSADFCGRMTVSLKNPPFNRKIWYDMEAERLDLKGM